jgi:acyl carrier protein
MREALAGKLPEYAVPQFFIPLERMPLNAGGKIDRRSLPALSAARPQLENPYEPPQTDLEAQLAGIWGEVLGLDQVGVSDRFFDLGGHSLLASRIISRVLKHFRVEVPLQELLEAPTITDMASMIEAHERQALSDSRFETLVREIESLSEEEVRDLLGQG